MVAELVARHQAIAASGTQVAFVHMHDEQRAGSFFGRYGLSGVTHVSDPQQRLYEAFGLARARPRQWLRMDVLKRYLGSLRRGHRPGYEGADVLRMHGAFLIERGTIVRAWRPESVAERLDWEAMLGG